VETPVISDDILVEIVSSITINEDSLYTASRSINLTLLSENADEMIIGNDSSFTGRNWESYNTTKNWMLPIGKGPHYVYAKFRNNSGAISSIYYDDILPQPINPGIAIEGGSLYTPTRSVELTLSASGSNLEMKISEDSTFAGINWQTYFSPVNFQLSTGEGVKKVFAKFKNDFEIESNSVKDSITLDITPSVPILIVTPDSGITNETNFQFDPTGSYDNLSPIESLQVRFDWENDGNWDVGWQHLSITNNIYLIGGGDKFVKMQIQDGAGWMADTTEQIFVNTRPEASFTAIQDVTNDSLFHFDASASYDYEDGTNLEYRWDFDGDGVWETGWLTQNIISYLYANDDDYMVKLAVRDQNSLSNETTLLVSVVLPVVDIDGNIYHVVRIGDQWWLLENLKVTHYNNGDTIPNVTDNGIWSGTTLGAYCNYNNDTTNVATYGRLYNWYAVNDIRNIAPVGWHVPTDDEWKQLEMYLGMSQSQANATGWRGTDEGGKLKEAGTIHWIFPNTGATNSSGFTALPGGYRSSNGSFYDVGYVGNWWSSTEYNSGSAWQRRLYYTYIQVGNEYFEKHGGFSVRCVRD
jgi:uncharacterized protein (TIGR02145 family)